MATLRLPKVALGLAGAPLLLAHSALARVTVEQRCAALRARAWAKYEFCEKRVFTNHPLASSPCLAG